MKLYTTLGVELTYHAPMECVTEYLRKNNVEYDYMCLQYLRDRCRELGIRYYHLSSDGLLTNAFEIATPAFNTLNGVKRWYMKWEKFLLTTPFRATDDYFWKPGDVWEGTGGGHIHVGIPKKFNSETHDVFVYNMIVLVAKYPWLNWVFNETCDVYNANSLLGATRRKFHQDSLHKKFAARFSWEHETVELRFFDAPKDWKQLREHIDVANAIAKYCGTLAKKGILVKKSKFKSLRAWHEANPDPVKTTKKQLREFCSLLGLRYEVYKKYIKNLENRIEEGYRLS